ncbi:MAG: GNAT family N-acetyltransferase [Bacteroidia bacterium]
MNLVLESDRLYMREFRLEDAELMMEMESDPEVHKFLGKQPVKNVEELKTYINGVLNQYESNGIGRFNTFLKDTNEYVGWVGLKVEKHIRDFEYYDLGYRFARKHWGKGYATEGSKIWLAYGFKTMQWQTINAAAEVAHIKSNHVLQKIGMRNTEQFEFEGELCNWYEMNKNEFLNNQK